VDVADVAVAAAVGAAVKRKGKCAKVPLDWEFKLYLYLCTVKIVSFSI